VKQYEGLFILDTDTSGATVDDIIKAIGELIKEAGGKVTNEQKLDRRSFARVADKKHSGGFYVSLHFELEAGALEGFRLALRKREEVFRTQITLADPVPA
tara:strand:- start:168 stop:467 length:300 start_codon:yes stop_codon:yes gene_type:complete